MLCVVFEDKEEFSQLAGAAVTKAVVHVEEDVNLNKTSNEKV
jgi:hypothetical protein